MLFHSPQMCIRKVFLDLVLIIRFKTLCSTEFRLRVRNFPRFPFAYELHGDVSSRMENGLHRVNLVKDMSVAQKYVVPGA